MHAPSTAHSSPPGVCIWLTGLSGAGKSTTAIALQTLLRAHRHHATVLDGDIVRTAISRELGFSRADRDENVRRVGDIAARVVRTGGIVVCALVSPYRSTRDEVRALIGRDRFVEVFVDTPLAICEERDPKGLYARARCGDLTGLTGIDDLYEPPLTSEIILDTLACSAQDNARRIFDFLIEAAFVWEPQFGGQFKQAVNL
jgi:sulfate adenylyltransferase